MRTHRFSRRSLLEGLGLGALAPFVPLLETRAQQMAPRRLIVMHSPNGVGTIERWRPSGSEAAFTLSDMLSPLQPFQQKLIVLDGIKNSNSVGEHTRAESELLTGWRSLRPGAKSSTRANGISVDQHVANLIGEGTRFSSLQLGVRNGPEMSFDGLAEACIVYKGPSQPVLPQSDPAVVFDRLFGAFRPVPTGSTDSLADRRSVLDLVKVDLQRLRPQLSPADRLKMDAHLDAIRAIEKTLVAPATASCAIPERGGLLDARRDANIPALGKAQIDLMVAALACDLTRVATLQWGNTGWTATFTFLGHRLNSHSLNHSSTEPLEARLTQTAAAVKWFSGQFAYLLQRLRDVQEPGGTMLDNAVIMWAQEFGDAGAHRTNPMPVLLAGGAGGAWRTGRYLRFPTVLPHNNVLLSLCRAMGLTDQRTFGDPALCTGPVPGLA